MINHFIVASVLVTTAAIGKQKKAKQPPPPPPPPKVEQSNLKFPPPVVYPDPLPDDYKAFLKRNPTVKGIGWMSGNKVRILLKSGKDEVYNLQNETEASNLEKKYGELPAPPPPPPPAPPPPKS